MTLAGKRILIDASMSRGGGGFTYMANMIPALVALEPDARFVVLVRNPKLAEALSPAPNLEVRMLPERGLLGRLAFMALRAGRLAREVGADLYFSVAEYAPLLAPCRVVVSLRNPNVFTSLDQGWPLYQRIRLGTLRRLAVESARRAARVVFVSHDSAKWMGDAAGIEVPRRSVVHHGIDEAAFARRPEASSEDDVGILSVSTVYRYKNFVRLIEAYGLLAQRLESPPPLTIVGDEQDPEYARQMLAARAALGPLAERVRIVGAVPYMEIASYYAAARLFVFPSYLETFGHPLLEAMAAGLPIVAADIPVFREIAADAAVYANPHSARRLPTQLRSCSRTLRDATAVRPPPRRACATSAGTGPRRSSAASSGRRSRGGQPVDSVEFGWPLSKARVFWAGLQSENRSRKQPGRGRTMRSLLRRKWVHTTIDYHRGSNDYRVRVLAFANIDKLTDLYFVRPRSARLIWNYLAQIGPVGVWRKVASRLQERVRNEKYVSFGYGEILEAPADGAFALGDRVAMFAPGFPACVERVVLPESLLALDDDPGRLVGAQDSIAYLPLGEKFDSESAWWQIVRRWDSHSGERTSDADRHAVVRGLAEVAQKLDWSQAEDLAVEAPSEIRETRSMPANGADDTRKRAVLFGYGHYAKTNILPNVRPDLRIDAVHEVDPTQIPRDGGGIPHWDTSPRPRADEDYDVHLIAGYHHTHAPLATEALRRGAYAVAEKPVAVDHAQLDDLLDALDDSRAGYFACFHKRYSPLNDLALHDLRQPPGAPIDYHCIVYEVPLPDLHWYRWPNSKSRLVSNGCHWLDHFLYVNGFAEVADFELGRSPSDVMNCSVTLENGAYFTMVLTDNGSERIGLQDYVEMRAGEVTAKVVNNATYVAEDRDRVIRRTTINKMTPYKQMYRSIARRIARGESGDTAQSIRVSTRLVLDLEDELVRRSAVDPAQPVDRPA